MNDRLSRIKQMFFAEDGRRIGETASAADIVKLERRLGVTFPESFKWFLVEIGTAVWPETIYGIGANYGTRRDFALVDYTTYERDKAYPPMPHHLIPFSPDGFGNHYCLDTMQLNQGECPVVFWSHECGPDQVPDFDAASFFDWLENMIARE